MKVLKGVDNMPTDYMNNIQNIVSSILFTGFKGIVIILVSLLIISLVMLAIGCLIKSQKIKSKFLIAVPNLLLVNIFFLAIPYIFVLFRNMI